jgi:glycerol kinase
MKFLGWDVGIKNLAYSLIDYNEETQTKEIIDAMNLDSGHPITGLKVDGGLTNSHLLLQIQSDLLGVGVGK